MHDLFKILIYNTRHFKAARNKQGNDSASILLFLPTLRCFLCAFHCDLIQSQWGKILKNQAYLQSLYWWLHWHVLLLHTEKYYLRKNFWITEAGLECCGKSVFGQVLEPSTGTLNSTWIWERTWCQDVVTNIPGKDTLESLSSFHFPMFNANEQSEELFERVATIPRTFLLKSWHYLSSDNSSWEMSKWMIGNVYLAHQATNTFKND